MKKIKPKHNHHYCVVHCLRRNVLYTSCFIRVRVFFSLLFMPVFVLTSCTMPRSHFVFQFCYKLLTIVSLFFTQRKRRKKISFDIFPQTELFFCLRTILFCVLHNSHVLIFLRRRVTMTSCDLYQ